jgi:hypothetical protein
MTTNDDDVPDSKKPPLHEHPDDTRRRLYEWHKRAGTLGVYYHMYPRDCPPDDEPAPTQPRGRGR